MVSAGSGRLRLIDFGTIKDTINTELNGLDFVGTAEYMSPVSISPHPLSRSAEYMSQYQSRRTQKISCLYVVVILYILVEYRLVLVYRRQSRTARVIMVRLDWQQIYGRLAV